MRERKEKPYRFTAYLRGEAALRLQALAFELWVQEGRSRATKPSLTEAIRQLVMGLVSVKKEPVQRYRCLSCEEIYGAPWCPDHEDKALELLKS